jgi:predicted RNase H-like HicB family nuclease
MKNIIQFIISEEDGVYIASGVNIPIVTDGQTFEELKKNIKEAVELFFEGENMQSLGFGIHPSILTNFELSLDLYGSKA